LEQEIENVKINPFICQNGSVNRQEANPFLAAKHETAEERRGEKPRAMP